MCRPNSFFSAMLSLAVSAVTVAGDYSSGLEKRENNTLIAFCQLEIDH